MAVACGGRLNNWDAAVWLPGQSPSIHSVPFGSPSRPGFSFGIPFAAANAGLPVSGPRRAPPSKRFRSGDEAQSSASASPLETRIVCNTARHTSASRFCLCASPAYSRQPVLLYASTMRRPVQRFRQRSSVVTIPWHRLPPRIEFGELPGRMVRSGSPRQQSSLFAIPLESWMRERR